MGWQVLSMLTIVMITSRRSWYDGLFPSLSHPPQHDPNFTRRCNPDGETTVLSWRNCVHDLSAQSRTSSYHEGLIESDSTALRAIIIPTIASSSPSGAAPVPSTSLKSAKCFHPGRHGELPPSQYEGFWHGAGAELRHICLHPLKYPSNLRLASL